jgi:nitrogen regulatory protein PII 1
VVLNLKSEISNSGFAGEGVNTMIMIRSIVRPEKVDDVMAALMEAGFPGVTKISVVGRGKQRGIKIGEITYDEIPKELLMTVVRKENKDFVVSTIIKAARSGEKGAAGDGKIFIVPVLESYTISSGMKELPDGVIEEVEI